jgi:serine/threonine-protein kinase
MSNAVKTLPVETFVRAPDVTLHGETVTVPDLTGQDPTAATAALQKLGLDVSVDANQVTSDQPLGKVASTDPATGAKVYVGTKVTIFVSNGTPPAPSGSPPASPPGSAPPGSPPASPTATESHANPKPGPPKKKKKP